MRLQRVLYRLFDFEINSQWTEIVESWHQLDGELLLEAADGTAKFISWYSEPVQYCIGVSGSSAFKDYAVHAIDLSAHPFWKSLVGSVISFDFQDEERQVLSISGPEGALFLSSQYDDGTFLGDCVRVGVKNPL